MAAQLDRLSSMIGLDTVPLGIIPFGVRPPFSPKHGFWTINALAAITAQTSGLLRGPRKKRVVWDLPRSST